MSASIVCFADEVEVPLNVRSLKEFRRWAFSKDFPESGRIDYIGGRIEVDMSPEDAYTHGSPKVEIVRVLANLLETDDRGYLLTDRMRITCPAADLSAEPDVVFVSYAALDSGRVRAISAKRGRGGSCLEYEGGPEFVVEIMSPSSIRKDTRDLPQAYFDAGVEEYWLVDAIHEEFQLRVFGRGRNRFVPRRPDQDGFMKSTVWRCGVQMLQRQTPHGLKYKLLLK